MSVDPGQPTARPHDHTSGVMEGEQEDDRRLRESLHGLSQLATSGMALEDLLTQVAGYAVSAIPGADAAGLTVLEEHRPDTVVTTAEFVEEVERLQYAIGQGPCITAARDGQTVVSGSLGSDRRWPRFGGAVARLGVHSVVSLPLVTSSGLVGAMNVYGREKHAFDDRAGRLGATFARPAAVAVQNAHVLAETQRLVTRLQRVLESRAVVDRAVGIIISRSGGSEDDALNRLRALSQNGHQKLSEIAQRIVDEARRRAEARRQPR